EPSSCWLPRVGRSDAGTRSGPLGDSTCAVLRQKNTPKMQGVIGLQATSTLLPRHGPIAFFLKHAAGCLCVLGLGLGNAPLLLLLYLPQEALKTVAPGSALEKTWLAYYVACTVVGLLLQTTAAYLAIRSWRRPK